MICRYSPSSLSLSLSLHTHNHTSTHTHTKILFAGNCCHMAPAQEDASGCCRARCSLQAHWCCHVRGLRPGGNQGQTLRSGSEVLCTTARAEGGPWIVPAAVTQSRSRIVYLNTSYRKAHALPPLCPDYYADLLKAPPRSRSRSRIVP
jgi:hypothetical protein